MYLPIHQVHRKHTQMFIKEFDISVIDTLRNLLSDLMRTPSLNHIQPRPSVLRLSTRRSADEQIVLHLALEVILLHVVC